MSADPAASTLSVGRAAVPEAPPSWSKSIVGAAGESPGRADGAESPGAAAAVGSVAAPGAPLAAVAAAVPEALVAVEASQGQWHHTAHRGH